LAPREYFFDAATELAMLMQFDKMGRGAVIPSFASWRTTARFAENFRESTESVAYRQPRVFRLQGVTSRRNLSAAGSLFIAEATMTIDPFADLKKRQREMWASFSPTAIFTTPVAGRLVKFAEINAGELVLDVGTGTGVVAITAARAGARVTALDLTPQLLAQARENASIAQTEDIVWTEGDAEALPYPDASFDVVLSQFGHMFAPRPDVTIAEMRRVLKPNGRIAFATWPPEHFVGRMFAVVAKNSPPPPPGAAPPPQWGIPAVIGERLGSKFDAPFFERGTLLFPALSIAHYRLFMERSVGPMQKLVESLADNPQKLSAVRGEFDALVAQYYFENIVHMDYIFTRAHAC
jgi:SAM-dependent methyltransferase